MKFVTVENKTLGKRTSVPESRLKHLTEDWTVVHDTEHHHARKRTAAKPRQTAAAPEPPVEPTVLDEAPGAEQPTDSATGANPEE